MDERQILKDGFAKFVTAAGELEAGYAALKKRAESVDLALEASNLALQQSLAEREAVFSALPIGLVALRADGSHSSNNCEAERLIAIAQSAGLDLLEHRTGEVAFADTVVRLRRVDLPDGELVLLEDRSRLEELEKEVRRLDRLAGLSELALGVAHEIKNPLNGVMGFANLLERSDDSPTMRRYAGKISKGVRAVDEIVKALLGFARPSHKPASVAPLDQVIGRVASAANLPRTRWQLRGACDALVDADALGRVMANLIRNAVEAAPRVRLTMDATLRHGQLELLVEDDGPGIADDVAKTVFEPFVSTKQRGTGLGLALSTRVLSFLGGGLELLNPGKAGARFLVRIPVVTAAKLAEASA